MSRCGTQTLMPVLQFVCSGSEEVWQHRLGLAALLLEQLPTPPARTPPPALAALPGGIAGLHAALLAPALEHASPALRQVLGIATPYR